jgi:hypothetical protein
MNMNMNDPKKQKGPSSVREENTFYLNRLSARTSESGLAAGRCAGGCWVRLSAITGYRGLNQNKKKPIMFSDLA